MEYRNPQNEPGSDKRMLLALLSVFLVLGVMQFFLPKPQPPPQEKGQAQQTQPTPAAPLTTASATPTPPKAPAVAARVPVKAAASEAETVLENASYRITFTNRGAVVKSWLLIAKNKNGTYRYTDNAGKPFDLVNQIMVPQAGSPLSLFAYDDELKKKINEALYLKASADESKP